MVLLDRRLGRSATQHLLAGPRRAVYRMLDSATSLRGLLQVLSTRYPEHHWSEAELQHILDEFGDSGLIMREDNMHLALAVLPPEDGSGVSSCCDCPQELAQFPEQSTFSLSPP